VTPADVERDLHCPTCGAFPVTVRDPRCTCPHANPTQSGHVLFCPVRQAAERADAERAARALIQNLDVLPAFEAYQQARAHIEQQSIELARLAAENEGIEAAISKVDDPSMSVRDNILRLASEFDAEAKHRLRADSRIAALEIGLRELLELVEDAPDSDPAWPAAIQRTRALLPETKP
jgi:hypothetical protein